MNNKRVIVFGLDGGSFDVAGPIMQAGGLPNLRRLLQRGVSGPLQSVFPPLTCPAWFCFSTGLNPARIGAFNFFRMEPGSYRVRVLNNRDLNGLPELWDLLGAAGLKSAIVNNPLSYPPRPINGVMVSGFIAPTEFVQYTYPPQLKHQLDRIAGGYEIDCQMKEYSDESLVSDCHRLIKKRNRVFSHLLQDESFDFFLLVFTETDRVCHQLLNAAWGDGEDRQQAWRWIRDVYEHVDRAIGELMNHVSDDDTVIVMSDHGFGRRNRGLYLNQWLIENGYLRLKKAGNWLQRLGLTRRNVSEVLDKLGLKRWLKRHLPPQVKQILPAGPIEGMGLSILSLIESDCIDWSATRAICIPENMNGIYFNTTDRPQGIVHPGRESDELAEEIITKLKRFVDPQTSRPLRIFAARGKELFAGPYENYAPDIMLVIEDYAWAIISNIPEDGALVDDMKLAHHRANGMLIAAGPGIKQSATIGSARLIDLTPTILHVFGLPVPQQMDGRVLQELFERPAPVATSTTPAAVQPAETPYDADEERIIAERLESLGYME